MEPAIAQNPSRLCLVHNDECWAENYTTAGLAVVIAVFAVGAAAVTTA
jgi:hypothetical protein